MAGGKNKKNKSKGKGREVASQSHQDQPSSSSTVTPVAHVAADVPASTSTSDAQGANVAQAAAAMDGLQVSGDSNTTAANAQSISTAPSSTSARSNRVVSTIVRQVPSKPDYTSPDLQMARAVPVNTTGVIEDYRFDTRERFEQAVKEQDWKNFKMDEVKRTAFVRRKKDTDADFNVRTNFFMMDFHLQGEDDQEESEQQAKDDFNRLYVYQLKGIRSDMPRPEKKALMKSMISRCDLLHSQKDSFATDNVNTIVAWKDLSLYGDPNLPAKIGEVIAQISVPQPQAAFANAPRRNMTVELEFLKTFEYEHINDYIEGYGNRSGQKYEQLDHALHVIITKAIREQSEPSVVQIGSNKLYPKSGLHRLAGNNENKVAIRGYTYSHHAGMGCHFLNVNTSMSLFHIPMRVSEYISRNRRLDRHLIGVKIWVNFSRAKSFTDKTLDERNHRIKTIAGFSTRNASQQTAYHDSPNQPVTVYQHMQRNYRGKSHGTAASICVNVGGTERGKEVWFPAEDLDILPYQQFRGEMSPQLTSAMIKEACRTPLQNQYAISSEFVPLLGIKNAADLSGMPRVLREAKIRIYPQLVCAPAYRATIPELRYRQIQNDPPPEDGTWLLSRQQFLSNTKHFQDTVFFLLPGNSEQSMQTQSDYLKLFFDHVGTNGVRGLPPFTQLDQYNSHTLQAFDETDIRQGLDAAVNHMAGLVVLILPLNNKENIQHYAMFKKLCDQEFGITSLCLCENKIMGFFKTPQGIRIPTDGADSPKFAGYARSVGMKLNARIGNSNHGVTGLEANIPDFKQEKHVMILGADVVHPGTSSHQYTPSIAALVGSVGPTFTKFFGSARHQPGRQEIIDDMQSMAEERLNAYKKLNQGQVPTRILYYRDGIDAGQFSQVLRTEVKAIREAWNLAAQGTSAFGSDVKITTVVVTKRHSTRLYPQFDGEKGRCLPKGNGNCYPGTVVESVITMPYHFDFYLLSHKALHGTGRPAHYIVLQNEMGFSPNQMHNLTNILTYTYCRSTTAVSYVPAAYYADHLCERVKHYLRGLYDGAPGFGGTEAQVAQQVRGEWGKGGRPDGNPWREELDGTMFWM